MFKIFMFAALLHLAEGLCFNTLLKLKVKYKILLFAL